MIITEINERQDINNGDMLYMFFDMITIDELRRFTMDALNESGTEEKLEEANRVADILMGMLKKKGFLGENSHQSFVDVLLTATLIHNLFYDEEDWTTIYRARRVLEPVAKDMKINQQVTDAIFQTVEAQMGDDTPVPTSRPNPNTPTELFAWAVWFAKEFRPRI
jgi:hypothetical protein